MTLTDDEVLKTLGWQVTEADDCVEDFYTQLCRGVQFDIY